MQVDVALLSRWMNARKVTAERCAIDADLNPGDLEFVHEQDYLELTGGQLERLARALDVAPAMLTRTSARPRVVVQSAEQLLASQRAIQRDGIHFYNYYSLPAPPHKVGGVVLDILCEAGRLPALNNGHREPAITVNLGPGDIYARWAEDPTQPGASAIMRANRSSAHAWVVGDSYVESSFCPHSYGLTSETPARIISYTAPADLDDLLDEVATQTPDELRELLAILTAREGLLEAELRRRAIPLGDELRRRLAEALHATDVSVLRQLARELQLDYRLLLTAADALDVFGKRQLSIAESAASIRQFEGYRVATIAGSAALPNLSGFFMSVDSAPDPAPTDLCQLLSTTYFVTGGEVSLTWRIDDRQTAGAMLAADCSAWVAPFVRHGFTGSGHVVALLSGRHFVDTDGLLLTRAYDGAGVVERCHRDRENWGYESQLPVGVTSLDAS